MLVISSTRWDYYGVLGAVSDVKGRGGVWACFCCFSEKRLPPTVVLDPISEVHSHWDRGQRYASILVEGDYYHSQFSVARTKQG